MIVCSVVERIYCFEVGVIYAIISPWWYVLVTLQCQIATLIVVERTQILFI